LLTYPQTHSSPASASLVTGIISIYAKLVGIFLTPSIHSALFVLGIENDYGDVIYGKVPV
jgi:ABC-type xylose transport system permease subunit